MKRKMLLFIVSIVLAIPQIGMEIKAAPSEVEKKVGKLEGSLEGIIDSFGKLSGSLNSALKKISGEEESDEEAQGKPGDGPPPPPSPTGLPPTIFPGTSAGKPTGQKPKIVQKPKKEKAPEEILQSKAVIFGIKPPRKPGETEKVDLTKHLMAKIGGRRDDMMGSAEEMEDLNDSRELAIEELKTNFDACRNKNGSINYQKFKMHISDENDDIEEVVKYILDQNLKLAAQKIKSSEELKILFYEKNKTLQGMLSPEVLTISPILLNKKRDVRYQEYLKKEYGKLISNRKDIISNLKAEETYIKDEIGTIEGKNIKYHKDAFNDSYNKEKKQLDLLLKNRKDFLNVLIRALEKGLLNEIIKGEGSEELVTIDSINQIINSILTTKLKAYATGNMLDKIEQKGKYVLQTLEKNKSWSMLLKKWELIDKKIDLAENLAEKIVTLVTKDMGNDEVENEKLVENLKPIYTLKLKLTQKERSNNDSTIPVDYAPPGGKSMNRFFDEISYLLHQGFNKTELTENKNNLIRKINFYLEALNAQINDTYHSLGINLLHTKLSKSTATEDKYKEKLNKIKTIKAIAQALKMTIYSQNMGSSLNGGKGKYERDQLQEGFMMSNPEIFLAAAILLARDATKNFLDLTAIVSEIAKIQKIIDTIFLVHQQNEFLNKINEKLQIKTLDEEVIEAFESKEANEELDKLKEKITLNKNLKVILETLKYNLFYTFLIIRSPSELIKHKKGPAKITGLEDKQAIISWLNEKQQTKYQLKIIHHEFLKKGLSFTQTPLLEIIRKKESKTTAKDKISVLNVKTGKLEINPPLVVGQKSFDLYNDLNKKHNNVEKLLSTEEGTNLIEKIKLLDEKVELAKNKDKSLEAQKNPIEELCNFKTDKIEGLVDSGFLLSILLGGFLPDPSQILFNIKETTPILIKIFDSYLTELESNFHIKSKKAIKLKIQEKFIASGDPEKANKEKVINDEIAQLENKTTYNNRVETTMTEKGKKADELLQKISNMETLLGQNKFVEMNEAWLVLKKEVEKFNTEMEVLNSAEPKVKEVSAKGVSNKKSQFEKNLATKLAEQLGIVTQEENAEKQKREQLEGKPATTQKPKPQEVSPVQTTPATTEKPKPQEVSPVQTTPATTEKPKPQEVKPVQTTPATTEKPKPQEVKPPALVKPTNWDQEVTKLKKEAGTLISELEKVFGEKFSDKALEFSKTLSKQAQQNDPNKKKIENLGKLADNIFKKLDKLLEIISANISGNKAKNLFSKLNIKGRTRFISKKDLSTYIKRTIDPISEANKKADWSKVKTATMNIAKMLQEAKVTGKNININVITNGQLNKNLGVEILKALKEDKTAGPLLKESFKHLFIEDPRPKLESKKTTLQGKLDSLKNKKIGVATQEIEQIKLEITALQKEITEAGLTNDIKVPSSENAQNEINARIKNLTDRYQTLDEELGKLDETLKTTEDVTTVNLTVEKGKVEQLQKDIAQEEMTIDTTSLNTKLKTLQETITSIAAKKKKEEEEKEKAAAAAKKKKEEEEEKEKAAAAAKKKKEEEEKEKAAAAKKKKEEEEKEKAAAAKKKKEEEEKEKAAAAKKKKEEEEKEEIQELPPTEEGVQEEEKVEKPKTALEVTLEKEKEEAKKEKIKKEETELKELQEGDDVTPTEEKKTEEKKAEKPAAPKPSKEETQQKEAHQKKLDDLTIDVNKDKATLSSNKTLAPTIKRRIKKDYKDEAEKLNKNIDFTKFNQAIKELEEAIAVIENEEKKAEEKDPKVVEAEKKLSEINQQITTWATRLSSLSTQGKTQEELSEVDNIVKQVEEKKIELKKMKVPTLSNEIEKQLERIKIEFPELSVNQTREKIQKRIEEEAKTPFKDKLMQEVSRRLVLQGETIKRKIEDLEEYHDLEFEKQEHLEEKITKTFEAVQKVLEAKTKIITAIEKQKLPGIEQATDEFFKEISKTKPVTIKPWVSPSLKQAAGKFVKMFAKKKKEQVVIKGGTFTTDLETFFVNKFNEMLQEQKKKEAKGKKAKTGKEKKQKKGKEKKKKKK